MPHQIALTLMMQTTPEGAGQLKALLGAMHENRDRAPLLPFGEMSGVHFARFFVIDAAATLIDREPLPPKLAYLANIDAPEEAHLAELVDRDTEGLDAIFSHCLDYPSPDVRNRETRLAYLRQHRIRSQAFYVNGIGRSVNQIRQERELREGIETFLDSRDWTGCSDQEVRTAIQTFVRDEPSLAWAASLAEKPALSFRLKETLDLVLVPLVVLLLLPLLLLLAPIFLILLRRHEERDVPDRSSASKESIKAARADEDFGVQNQIIALGHFKPGWFRRLTVTGILRLTDWTARHIFVRGALSGLRTIHFARWVRLDGHHRMFFVSNYDGGLESYQNDFIDKAASGLNAIFSNGDGFPYTRFLILNGIRDEQAYKRFLPTRQVLTQVWYSAYEDLSVININNNAKIRANLFGDMSAEATREWLRRF